MARGLILFSLLSLLGGSGAPAMDPRERVRRYTRPLEFQFERWTLKALGVRAMTYSLGAASHIEAGAGANLVRDYFAQVDALHQGQAELEAMLGDPRGVPQARVEAQRAEVASRRALLARLQPHVEAVMQEQVAASIAEMGLGLGGKVVPPVAFRFTPLPLALVVSPRHVIRQEANVQIDPQMPLEEQIALEKRVEREGDLSALVVHIGGVGTYPTMVLESTSLPWVLETVGHEWVHNYLTLRPLGLAYNRQPELRTMNETVASLVGKAISERVLARYYPELLPAPEPPPLEPQEPAEPPSFDFRAEMHATRLKVDALLAEGKIAEAEAYMEERRRFFWEHGYRIRRLNQAYFAFHGAYADQPQGPAGEDPIGAAVRELWRLVGAPARFLRLMAWMDSLADLEAALARWRASG
jgi:hypothetical protein